MIGRIGAPAKPHEDPAGIRHVRGPLALKVWEKTEAVASWIHHAPRLGQPLGCPAEPPPDHFRRPRHVWPETPMPRISIPAAPERPCRTAATVASIHQDGCCLFLAWRVRDQCMWRSPDRQHSTRVGIEEDRLGALGAAVNAEIRSSHDAPPYSTCRVTKPTEAASVRRISRRSGTAGSSQGTKSRPRLSRRGISIPTGTPGAWLAKVRRIDR